MGDVSAVAFLVLGSDGSSTLHASSSALSTSADRTAFLNRRRAFDCIIVGGQTAANESYRKTPVPLIVVSRTHPAVLDQNPQSHWWPIDPAEAVKRARTEFGSEVCIEGGVKFLVYLLEHGCVDRLELSITPAMGGENPININELLNRFTKRERQVVEDTIFYSCSEPKLLSK